MNNQKNKTMSQVDIQSENQLNKSGRGGKRPGAGRPKGTSKLYAFRADKEVAAYLDSQENKTDFIKQCITQQMEAVKHRKEDEVLMQLGEVMPTSRIKPMTLPFFDVKVVAGFPIPLNNDEQAQNIEVLKMCIHPIYPILLYQKGFS